MMDFYAVPFWDVSTPSFVSADIHYFCTKEDIAAFAAACRKSDSHEEFLRAYTEWESGKADALINVAYNETPVAEPVDVLGSGEAHRFEIEWEMLNTWFCTYNFKAEELRRELVWIKHGERYLRAARYTIKGLLEDFHTAANRWGNAEVIAFEEGSDADCHSLFYFPERYFNSEEECRNDMAAPAFNPSEDLRALCFEFIGDG